MTGFLFQASADHYDLRVQPQPGAIVSWRAQRYRSLMLPGKIVFFWLAGESAYRGLHGWGTLTSAPYEHGDHYEVDARFDHRIVPHVPASVIQTNPVLRDHQIFTLRTGSNFLLEEAEVRALIGLIPAGQQPALALA
jgi:hypothetical protein